jgi:hypothetical protein
MTRDLYWTACTIAGNWRRGYLPHGVNLRSAVPKFPLVRKAVYIVCDPAGGVAYVGKVARVGDSLAVASRVNEHVVDPAKADGWARLYASRFGTTPPRSSWTTSRPCSSTSSSPTRTSAARA